VVRPTPLPTDSDLSPQIAIGVLLAAVLLTYGRLCGYDFVSWDDEPFIAKNSFFANPSWDGLLSAWTSSFYTIYIPLTRCLWLLLAIAGHGAPDPRWIALNPYLFHAANVAVHALAALAAFDVLRRLTKSTAAGLAGALIFALHPVQVESVGWISGLKDVLAGGLSLAAIAAYLAAVDTPDPARRLARYIGGVILVLLAMLAKPSAMTTPAVLIAIDWLLLRRPIKTVLLWASPWVALAAACALVARLFQPAMENIPVPLWARPLFVGHSLAFYLKQIAWPASLGIDYGHNPKWLLQSPALYWAWIVPAVLLIAAAAVYRRWRWPLTALAVFVLASAHTLGLVGFDFQRISTTADHYLYVPMFGIAMLAAWFFTLMPRKAAIGVFAVIAVALGIRSFVQTQTWRDSDTLFAHGLTVNPDSWAIRTSVAVLAIERQPPDLETAERESRRAIELEPNYALPYNTLGAVFARRGDLASATLAYRKAAELSPTTEFLTNLGSILAQQGRHEEAEQHLQTAVRLHPDDPSALLNLGTLKIERGRYAEAAVMLQRSMSFDPNNPRVRLNLAIALLAAGRRAEAIPHLQAAYSMAPDFPGLADTMRQAGVSP
jgi:tetratricopeptide (TPR) repeat protein